MAYTDGAYANVNHVAADLAYLGITTIRDSVPNPNGGIPAANQVSALHTLAADGIKFDLLVSPGLPIAQTIQQIIMLEQASPNCVIAVEGPNEINNNPVSYGGLTGQAAAVAYQTALYQAVKGTSDTAKLTVYGYTGGIAAPWTVAGTLTRNPDGSYTLANGQTGFPVTLPPGISTINLTFKGAGTGDSGLFPYPGHGQVTSITYSTNGTINYSYDNTSGAAQALYVDFADWGSTQTLTSVTVTGPGSSANLVTFDPDLSIAGQADDANIHPYAYGNAPIGPAISANYQTAYGSAAPGPRVITETGYTTDPNVPNGVSQTVQAQQIINGLLDAYQSGVSTTYLYELIDEKSDPSNSNSEMHYGLFNFDNTPKLAAVAVHNLTSLLSDTGADAASFQPGSFGFATSGGTAADQSMVLETSNGVFDLAFWNDSDPGTTAVDQVTVAFGQTYQNVSVYDVVTDEVTNYSDVSQVTVGVGADAMLVQIEPNQAASLSGSAVAITAGILGQATHMKFLSSFSQGGGSAAGSASSVTNIPLAAALSSLAPVAPVVATTNYAGGVMTTLLSERGVVDPLGLLASLIAKLQL